MEGKQYADAARVLIWPAPRRATKGLVPAPDDDQLFVSFRIALRLLMLQHRGLREAMARQIGPADQLKIEQTLARGDPVAVEALPLQYCGTPAAALPVNGWVIEPWLPRILPRPSRGMTKVSAGLRPRSSPTLRPANASSRPCWARPGGSRRRRPVSLGGVKVSPEQFEGWIRDQLARRRIAAEVASSADFLPVVAAAQPVRFQAAIFGQLNDTAGRGFEGRRVGLRNFATSIAPGGA